MNVVLPLPAPQVVPIAANRLAYVARDTARPSHKSHPAGAAAAAVMMSAPGGNAAGGVSVRAGSSGTVTSAAATCRSMMPASTIGSVPPVLRATTRPPSVQ